jgi:hypothetical protein
MVGGSSPGTPASSTTKTGHHDIAESGIKHNKSNQINYSLTPVAYCHFQQFCNKIYWGVNTSQI